MLTDRHLLSPSHPTTHAGIAAFALVAPALLAGLAARLHLLGEKDIWWDEGLAVWAARLPLRAMAEWTAVDVHPPLYFALLHFWRLAVGDSEFAVRYLSAALGVITVAAVGALARRIAGGAWAAAGIAAWLLALSRFAVWWSQEARMYCLAGLLVVLSLFLALRLAANPRWRYALLLAAVNAAVLWTLYLGGAVIAVEALYLLAAVAIGPARNRLTLASRSAASILLSLAAFGPWLAYMLPRTRTWSVQEAFDIGAFARLYASLLVTGESTGVDRTLGWWLPVLAGAALLGVIGWRSLPTGHARLDLLLLPAAVLLPAAAVAAATMLPRDFGYSPRPEARYLLPFAPAFAALLGASAALAARRLVNRATRAATAAGIAAALGVPALVWLPPYYADRILTDDYRSVAATLSAYDVTGDGIVLHSDHNWPVFTYHWSGPFSGTPGLQPADGGLVEATLGPIWARHDALWLVVNDDGLRADKDRLYERWLTDRAVERTEWRFGGARLVRFERVPDPPKLLALAVAARTGAPAEQRAIVAVETPLRRLGAGSTVNLFVDIDCAPAASAGREARVTLGQPDVARGAAELKPCAGADRLHLRLHVPAGTPAGRYPLLAALDDAPQRQVGALTVVTAGAAAATLGTVPEPADTVATFGHPPLIALDEVTVNDRAGVVALSLRWRALRPIADSYKVFVHVVTPDERIVAQRDDYPAGGARPTTGWQVGESVRETLTVQMPSAVPAGSVLYVGLYDPTSGERLTPASDRPGYAVSERRLRVSSLSPR